MVHYYLHLDPSERATGEETVLHWACQSRTKKEILQKLLAIKKRGWVIYMWHLWLRYKTTMYHSFTKGHQWADALQTCQRAGKVLLQIFPHLTEKDHVCLQAVTATHYLQIIRWPYSLILSPDVHTIEHGICTIQVPASWLKALIFSQNRDLISPVAMSFL